MDYIEDLNTVSECSFCGFGIMVEYKTISLMCSGLDLSPFDSRR